MKKRMLAALLTAAMVLSMLAGCGGSTEETTNTDVAPAASAEASASADATGDASGDVVIANEISEGSYTMDLTQCSWSYVAGADAYALENVVYCEAPLSTSLQSMNIYVPAAYMNEDGTINETAEINGYTAATAPIVYVNGIAGYMEATPNTVKSSNEYLSAGMIYVSVGSRGRASQGEDGTYIGKSPAGLVDLKAGIRLLRANDATMAGDCDKIVSVGTSAGGAMSSLLGTTGNSANYDSYLEAIGAVMDQKDDIYIAQCYCPITDLENADMAYEWQFEQDHAYLGFLVPGGDVSEFGQAISAQLADEYVDYYNSLGLVDFDGNALTLGEDGRSGSAYDLLMKYLDESATKFLSRYDGDVDAYLAGGNAPGMDITDIVSWDGTTATISSLDDLVLGYNNRLKTCLAFDDLDYAQGENEEFGDADTATVHFDTKIAPIIESLKDEYPDEYAEYYEAYTGIEEDEALTERKYLINPMNYIGTEEECDTAPYFRIRVGSYDPHTSWMVSMNLAMNLAENEDTDVDYAIVWDEPHGAADYEGEFVAYIEGLTK